MPAGTLFALPRGVLIDVLNIPDERSGYYQSLLIEVSELPQGVAPLTAEEARKPGQVADFSIPLTQDLVDAVGNARRELRDPAARAEVCRHRVAEILLLLRRVPQARPLFWQTLPDRIGWLVRSDPAAVWTVEEMAGRMGMGASTLRRHLAQAGQSFRDIVRAARMEAARDALAQGAPAGVAAELAGYASRSHFARRFREAFGTTPAEFA
ncbi:AraC family transcriptional regulator [Oceanicola sp. 22II-s10i]|uniref:AraC family transcriptional regulator n=1 Tax=Oceanicola sp. 22II-s10i TaxID=1317116 RepID=UPI000B520DEA|nr:AraC family transcriptional regulator [Oceanicola sp. 22II-s10i]